MYNAAIACDVNLKEQANQKIKNLFEKIEKERDNAIAAERRAIEAEQKSKQALIAEEEAKKRAENALKSLEEEKKKAQDAEKQALQEKDNAEIQSHKAEQQNLKTPLTLYIFMMIDLRSLMNMMINLCLLKIINLGFKNKPFMIQAKRTRVSVLFLTEIQGMPK